MMEPNIKIGGAVFWVAVYFGVMLFYTFLDVAVWRKTTPQWSHWLNLITMVICVCVFLLILQNKTGYRVRLLSHVTLPGILAAAGCSVLFFLLLDQFLDPIFDGFFPQSEQSYLDMVQSLMRWPVTSLLQVCVIAPVVEEILMRGFVLGGLKDTYGWIVALLISSLLFAILHFNMVQTLSALVCGIALGLLYLKTDSILCCIFAHCGYNCISYLAMIIPHIRK